MAETVKLSRPDVLAGLTKTVGMPAMPMPAMPARPESGMRLIAARPAVVPTQPPPPPAPMRVCVPGDDERLAMLADPTGAQSAGYRLLRDTLLTKGLPRVFAISSAESGEGKTTCAINLALALAEHHTERVLLVDANFAASSLSEILGIDETTEAAHPWCAPFGLSTITPSLHVATFGKRPGQSSPDFTTMARVLESFQRAGYHRIVLDMPALASSQEAELLLHLAGGVLLVVRSGRSTKRALGRAVDRIGTKALGVTLVDA